MAVAVIDTLMARIADKALADLAVSKAVNVDLEAFARRAATEAAGWRALYLCAHERRMRDYGKAVVAASARPRPYVFREIVP